MCRRAPAPPPGIYSRGSALPGRETVSLFRGRRQQRVVRPADKSLGEQQQPRSGQRTAVSSGALPGPVSPPAWGASLPNWLWHPTFSRLSQPSSAVRRLQQILPTSSGQIIPPPITRETAAAALASTAVFRPGCGAGGERGSDWFDKSVTGSQVSR